MINHLEILVEELSMERFLRHVVPRLLPEVSFDIRVFNGKPDLLRKLPDRLRGYRQWSAAGGLGIVVVVDRDEDDCRELLDGLNAEALNLGFSLCSVSRNAAGSVLNRVVVEELEAWYLGDVPALCSAYPGLPSSLAARRRFRDPDAVSGGTAEALEHVLKRAGHHRAGLRKLALATDVAPHLDLERNTSVSFTKFRDGLRLLARGAA